MGLLIYICALLSIIVIGLKGFIPKDDRRFAVTLLVLTLPIHLLVLYLINKAIPFVPSETDAFLYYTYSQYNYSNWTELFIFRTVQTPYGEFGGLYLHILTIAHQLIGDSLFWRKVLNLTALWPMAFAWYRIARFASGKRSARFVMSGVVWLPTLWYPFLVLYRDLITASLHSVFLAALIWYMASRKRPVTSLLVMFGSGFLLFLFRSATLLINGLVIVVVIVSWCLAQDRRSSVTTYIANNVAAASALPSGRLTRFRRLSGITNVAIFMVVCVTAVAVLLGGSVLNALQAKSVEVSIDSALLTLNNPEAPLILSRIPAGLILWVTSEPTIVSNQLDFSDPEQLRGIMNGPWFLIGVPFATIGLLIAGSLVFKRRMVPASGSISKPDPIPRFTVFSVLGFAVIWLVVGIVLWDWTRWRLPVVPALLFFAVWGSSFIKRDSRIVLLIMWGLVLIVWRCSR
jgi:hypothetical protein